MDQETILLGPGLIVKAIANPYDPSAVYATGDYRTINGKLYKCNEPITTPEPWTPSHWTQVKVADEILTEKKRLASLEQNVVTISQQSLSGDDQSQVRTNIGAASQTALKSKAPYTLNSVEQKTTGASSNVGAGSTVTQSVYAAVSGKTILGIVGIVGGAYSSSCAISEYYISNNTAYVVWRNCSSSSINLGATKINILYRENEPI